MTVDVTIACFGVRIMKKGTFRYIDKDKILPALTDKLKRFAYERYYSDEFTEGYLQAIEILKEEIEDGFYDWNDIND